MSGPPEVRRHRSHGLLPRIGFVLAGVSFAVAYLSFTWLDVLGTAWCRDVEVHWLTNRALAEAFTLVSLGLTATSLGVSIGLLAVEPARGRRWSPWALGLSVFAAMLGAWGVGYSFVGVLCG